MALANEKDISTLEKSKRETVQASSFWGDVWKQFRKHPTGMFGAGLVLLLVISAVFGPLLAPMDPNAMDFGARFASPSFQHWFGTDDFGRDILSRILYGARVSLQVAIIAVTLATVVGTTLGMIAGYSNNRIVDEIIMRSMDVLFAFPAILLAIAVLAALGKGVTNAMIAIGIVYIPIFARIARGEVLSVKEEEFVEVAHALGARPTRIMLIHILPNILSPIIVEISLSLSFAILAEAALSFFGLGVQPPDASWGRMLSEGRAYLQQSVWLGVFPGLAIMFTVMGFNFLGDGLRDSLDPHLRKA